VQGWDAKSYANAAEQYVKMGYDYIALGGLVRTSTIEMLHIVSEVNKVVSAGVDLHLFGIARPAALRPFARLGVTSVDSASHLRKAWMGTNDNYWTLDGEKYAAIRIPEIGKSKKAKELSKNGDVATARILEQRCLSALRQYDAGKMGIEETLDILEAFDLLLDPKSKRRQDYEKTLKARPWKNCQCTLCQTDGVEVIIFRGNNRNRRRGFHNTYVFYGLMKRVLNDEQFYINEAHKLFEPTTTPEALAEARAQAQAKELAKIEAKARAEAKALARIESKAIAETKALVKAEAKARAEAKALASARAKAAQLQVF
jgi:queuine/archaeosine tRNA-ribosyltransferase